jgi:hypothetical protein
MNTENNLSYVSGNSCQAVEKYARFTGLILSVYNDV